MAYYKGFYKILPDLQKDYLGEQSSKMIAKLSAIASKVPTGCKEPDEIPVSVASFLTGYCGNLAEYLHNTYGYEIGVVYSDPYGETSEGTYSGWTGDIIHVYNVAEIDGVKYYIDSRGITDNEKAFMALYGDFLSRKEYSSMEEVKETFLWYFTNNTWSSNMIGWLMENYGKYYKVKEG